MSRPTNPTNQQPTNKKRKSSVIELRNPTNQNEAQHNVTKALEWGKDYVSNLTLFALNNNQSAGRRARATLANLSRNSGRINRSMSMEVNHGL